MAEGEGSSNGFPPDLSLGSSVCNVGHLNVYKLHIHSETCP